MEMELSSSDVLKFYHGEYAANGSAKTASGRVKPEAVTLLTAL